MPSSKHSNPASKSPAASTLVHVLVVVDGSSEDVLDAIELANFDLPLFCQQFDVPVQYDPHMLDRYVVGPDDVAFLAPYLPRPIDFRFDSHGYWIEAVTR